MKVYNSLSENKIDYSLKSIVSFYKDYKYLIDDAAKKVSKDFEYPKIKVIDFVFWQLGYSAPCRDKENS